MTMPSSTSFRRGDIYLVHIRFSDGSGIKRRPAIIVSVDAFHESRRDALVVPLTTNVQSRHFGDHELADWDAAGLPRPSLAKGLIETIDRVALGRRLGEVSNRDLILVERSLRDVLGL